MRIKGIKTKNEWFFPSDKGEQERGLSNRGTDGVCYIKKLFGGRFRIDYYDFMITTKEGYIMDSQTPNARVILYPSGIEQVEYEV